MHNVLRRVSAGIVLLAGVALFPAAPAPWRACLVGTCLVLAVASIALSWRPAAGTALRGALVWGLIALLLALAGQVAAFAGHVTGDTPVTSYMSYLAVLAALAGLVSVLNARTPGGGAWALLTALLVVVFLIPWLEGAGIGRAGRGHGRIALESPWTIFYVLLVVAGLSNYLPTRYGPAAAVLGLGLGTAFVGLTRGGVGPNLWHWSVVAWCLGASACLAASIGSRPRHAASELEAMWLWFRDHWGVVWGLRVAERFNRTAEAQGWPVRLAWQGVVRTDGLAGGLPDEVEDATVATLAGLLRRFVEPERLARAAAAGLRRPCGPGGVG